MNDIGIHAPEQAIQSNLNMLDLFAVFVVEQNQAKRCMELFSLLAL